MGQNLPGGGKAIADGSYPNVFKNDTVDASFGVTAPIFLQQFNTGTSSVDNVINVPTAAGVTSFSSKSELAINLSQDGRSLTFMGYVAPVNTLDVSNSNTPNHVDATNPVKSSFQRAIIQMDSNGQVTTTPVDAYSGNNGRAAILANGNYYTVGNAGNGSGTQPTAIVNNTGVQMTTPGGNPETTVVGQQQGAPGSATGFQFGYSVTQYGFAADKSGKDDNFRGETIFNNQLYVTKGSGSNGINGVYAVTPPGGGLPTAANASQTTIALLPGFPTTLAKAAPTGTGQFPDGFTPFGIWFANTTILYVADEGDGTAANAGKDTASGLEKWVFSSGSWKLVYTLQKGLGLGQSYGIANYPANLDPMTDGLRNITGKVNGDGTVTLYGVTSTVSASGDQGADPNRLVTITDDLTCASLDTNVAGNCSSEQFDVLETASAGQVLRGVAFAPVPEPASALLLVGGFAGLAFARRQRV